MKRIESLLLVLPLLTLGACLGQTEIEPAWPFGGGEQPARDWQARGRFRQKKLAPPQEGTAQEEVAAEASSDAPADPAAETTPLLGWDGGVVDGPEDGAVVESQDPRHGLEPSLEGRMHIIELYQQVLDERDSLLGEVEALTAALQKAQTMLHQTQESAASLEARIAALEEGHRSLLAENQEIAGRLTTAQIRRLEAEKLLLESRIAWHRERLQAGGGQ